MLAMSVLLIFVTVVDGFKIASSPQFLLLEGGLTFGVTVDFLCRLKMTGFNKFFRLYGTSNWWWNYFDCFMVSSSLALFLLSVN